MLLSNLRAILRVFAPALAGVAVTILGATGAFAQGPPRSLGAAGSPPFTSKQLDKSLENTQRPPPAALPGAESKQAVAPPRQVPQLMSPNDALFDAIDRGDIAVARDALNRGAQLDARNVLGMTPIELSVDLGRNDISFLLLSMRNADLPPPRQAAPGGPPGTATLAASPPSMRRPVQTTAVSVATNPAPAVDPVAPKLFSGNGGTPIPQAGFLGFDSNRR